MKPNRFPNCRALPWCAFLALLLVSALDSFGAPTNAPATVAANNTQATEEPEFPKSVFDEHGGKDPFFPYRVLVPIIRAPDTKPNEAARSLVLNGISGPPNKPLAIINGYTFGIGDAAEVITSAGKLKIRCLEIIKNSVVLEIIDTRERKELHLRAAP